MSEGEEENKRARVAWLKLVENVSGPEPEPSPELAPDEAPEASTNDAAQAKSGETPEASSSEGIDAKLQSIASSMDLIRKQVEGFIEIAKKSR